MADTKLDRAPVQAGTTAEREDLYPESSRSLDALSEMRLMALLKDMIDAEDGAKTAKVLGVSYRTVSRAIETGRLTARMAVALERHLLEGGGSAAAQQRERVEALEKGMAELEGKLEDGLEELTKSIVGEVQALRDEQARAFRQVELRLAKLEAGQGASEATPEAVEEAAVEARTVEKPAVKPAWRLYRDLVTLDPEPGEEQVYGEATPLVVEWRRVRGEFMGERDLLRRFEAEERMRWLEIEMIGEHDLTLPPRTYPWDQFDRRDEVWERGQRLKTVRVLRNRALLRRWLRRILTLGLWRN